MRFNRLNHQGSGVVDGCETHGGRSWQWLRMCLTMLLAVAWMLPVEADNYYWRDKRVEVTSDGTNRVKVKYLTYDFDNIDDSLYELSIYVVGESEESERVLTHNGAREDCDDGEHKFNGGYGNDADYTSRHNRAFNIEQMAKIASGDQRYREFVIVIPQCFYGYCKLRFKGIFNYSTGMSDLLHFDFTKEIRLGEHQPLDPTIQSFCLPKPSQLQVTVANPPQWESCNTDVTITLTQGSAQVSKTFYYGPTETPITQYNMDLTADMDISQSFKAEAIYRIWRRSEGAELGPTTVDLKYKTKGNFAGFTCAEDPKAQFYLNDCETEVLWTPRNLNANQADFVSIFYRMAGGSWKPLATKLDRDTNKYLHTQADATTGILPEKTYEYKIVYGRNDWGEPSVSNNWGGIAVTEAVSTATSGMTPRLTASREPGAIRLDWEIPNSQELLDNNCDIIIQRAISTATRFTDVATVKYEKGGNGTYVDAISGAYKYKVVLVSKNTWYAKNYTSNEAEAMSIDATSIKSLRATKGEYAGRVHVEWNANVVNKATYSVLRRSLEDESSSFTKLSTMSSTEEYLQYDDDTALPGIYYEYRIEYATTTNDGEETPVQGSKTDIGFSSSSGKILGSITYGSGTAVEGVDVYALRNSSGNDMSSSRCLYFNGSALATVTDSIDVFKGIFKNGYTYQFWMKIDSRQTGEATIINAGAGNKLKLAKNDDGTYSIKYQGTSSNVVTFAQKLSSNTYYQVTLARSASEARLTVFSPIDDEVMTSESDTQSVYHKEDVTPEPGYPIAYKGPGSRKDSGKAVDKTEVSVEKAMSTEVSAQALPWEEKSLYSNEFKMGDGYNGTLDEMRVWSKVLTEKEIADNYNRVLVGNEGNLEMYYRFDEGLKSLFFDSSRKGSTQNGRHGMLNVNVTPSTDVPTVTQLGYRGKTDENGNYIIEGIPFGGEGTSYSVVPQLGIHEFSPVKQMRYIGPSTLVHNSTDFSDVSSFPVSGVVYYENTLYPVEGCSLYVDGTICSRDGEIIQTDENGRFTIDVPIGDHFIEVRNTQQGHTFVNAGRYPADPNKVGLKHTFNKTMSGLTFYESTLVNLSGRVTGGSVEGDKPLGFGLSSNTIGQVELQLQASNNTYSLNVVKNVDDQGVITYNNNPQRLVCEPATAGHGKFNSSSWRGARTKDVDNTKTIYIQTDPITGEFSAMLPPLKYKVISAKVIKSGKSIISNESGYPEYDLTTPMNELRDSTETDAGMKYYSCNNKIMLTYHSTPTFKVQDKNADPGAFGISDFTVVDKFGEVTVDDIYKVDENGNVNYRFGAPLFVMGDPYVFNLKGYEEYTNADNGKVVTVPLQGVEVTINNNLAADQAVYIEGNDAGQVAESVENKIKLDEKGEAIYKWTGGLPNINESRKSDVPNYARTISITYDIEGKACQWEGSGMYGILLGELTTGTNFVTAGPDKVDMVLRDPPGTKSHTEWTEGSSLVSTSTWGGTWNTDNTVMTHTALGVNIAILNGLGVAVINSMKAEHNLDVGLHIKDWGENSNTVSTTYTTSHTISTSDAKEFVGSKGDVYVGRSTNVTFGKARQIGLTRENASSPVELTKKEVVSTGLNFATSFSYSQHYIENILIPNLQMMLNQKLITMPESEIGGFVNNTNLPVYLTPHKPGDTGYGKRNLEGAALENAIKNGQSITSGPNYWMVPPASRNESYTDSVNWLITQIEGWQKTIAQNEKDKVEAFYNKNKDCFINNFSFDAGSSQSLSWENDTTKSAKSENSFCISAIGSIDWGTLFNNTGVIWTVKTETGGGGHSVDTESETVKTKFSYKLADSDPFDAISVDVLKSPAGWGPIFHTRAGQTSAPYEGKDVTKYYEPGQYVLSEATMQIEVPKIEVEVPVQSDVPTGSSAKFYLLLSNESEVNADVYFKLLQMEETNPNGAILKIDDATLTDNRNIKVPAGQTVRKLLALSQSDVSILDYNNIGLVLGSQSQYQPGTWDQITDTVFISAHFVPSSSEVALHVSSPVLNTSLGSTLTLTFDNFDRTFQGLKAFRLQYKAKGDANWSLAKEYVMREDDVTRANELLPSGATVEYIYPMHNFKDDEYTFRVLSVATYGADEVYRSSNEITVVKDMARPQLIGIPAPTDGILNMGDEISVVFNEDIRKGYLQSDANFIVRGRLNNADLTHDGVFQNSGGDGASSQSPVDLSRRSWSVSNWLKWTGAGSIFRHGTANNNVDIAVLDNGKLQVTIDGTSYTSDNAIPKDKWCYMNVAYDFNQGDPRITADVACDAESTSLFNREKVKAYKGNGVVTIGRGITAAIHEVTLWNITREWAQATSTKAQVLPASTDGLIGYWRLDEGHGTVGEDKARSRHLTLPAASSWSMEAPNFALELDGKNYAALDMSRTGTDVDQNYALEFWFRADKQEEPASIFSINGDQLELVANGDNLNLYANGQLNVLSTKNLMDNNWHHFALNVLKGSAGMATAYIDGTAMAQISADKLPAIQTDRMILGAHRDYQSDGNPAYTFSQYFKGCFDEVRFWNGTQSAAVLRENMYGKVEAESPALALYYPFEKTQRDSGGQIETVADLADHSPTKAADVEFRMGVTIEPQLTMLGLKDVKKMDNVPFSFVASERKITITLNAAENLIEGCNLQFTVRDVQDINGNYSKDITWSAFVQQNQLTWGQSEVKLLKEGANEVAFDVDIINSSGEIANWSLTDMPMWLTVEDEAGTLLPLSQKSLHFTVAPSTPIGRYDAEIGLRGENMVNTRLMVSLVVTGVRPDWTVNPADYENTMNLVAQLKINGAYSENAEDIVAAFIAGECRGIASPVYYPRYDTYFLTMNIYGNPADMNKPITYKVFDASIGEICPDVTATPTYAYQSDLVAGTLTDPVIFNTTNKREQSQALGKGWNWISLYVTPDDKSVDNVLASLEADIAMVKDKTSYTSIYNGAWTKGGLDDIQVGKMYKVRMERGANFRLLGSQVNPMAAPIDIYKGWNWIGFNSNTYLSPNEAFAGLNPQDGDVVKGRSSFAMYMDYEWVGSLTALTPGEGYVYMSNDEETKTMFYPSATSPTWKAPVVNDTRTPKYTPCDEHKYQSNMTMVAKVMRQGEPVNCELAVFDSKGECRGTNFSQADGLIFLTIQGEGYGEPLSFRVVFNVKDREVDVLADETYIFSNDDIVGSPDSPFVITLKDDAAINDIEADVDGVDNTMYDILGRRIKDDHPQTGVYIRANKKLIVK